MVTKKYDGPRYAFTQGVGKVTDDNFDIEGMKKGEARLLDSYVPDQKAMRYIKDDSLSGFLSSGAGGGRGGQGGPTAKELADYERKQNAGIFTEGKKMPPSPREMKKGGKVSSASSRADGIAQRGKTRGKMV
jgi:hypothetical protein